MGIKVRFCCDGCHKEAPETFYLRRHFDSFNGRGYGWGVYRTDTVEDIKPEGWQAFAPYTGCCYCPECWDDIESTELDNSQKKQVKQ